MPVHELAEPVVQVDTFSTQHSVPVQCSAESKQEAEVPEVQVLTRSRQHSVPVQCSMESKHEAEVPLTH